MRIFVAGATGAIGRQLLPKLAAAGHEVAGMTRTPAKLDDVRAMGAAPILADALDASEVTAAVTRFRPEVIVHELTDLGGLQMRDFEGSFVATNRLRTEGTDNLLAAGRAVGIRRFVAQSYAGWPFARSGSRVKTEDEPLDPDPIPPMRPAFEAIGYLERTTLAADWTEGIVLRYGSFYGPGTGLDLGGEQLELIRTRRWPVIGDGDGVWSFIHVEDAADATVAAIERGTRGVPRRRQRAGASRRVAARRGRAHRRKAAVAPATLARAHPGGRGGHRGDDRNPGGLERQGAP